MDPLTSGLNTDDSADIDQFRPAKKMKLEAGSLDVTEETRQEMADDDEDWDSIYGVTQEPENKPSAVEEQVGSAAVLPMTGEPIVSETAMAQEKSAPIAPEMGNGTLPLAAPGESKKEGEEKRLEDGLPAAMIDGGDELVVGDDPAMEGDNPAATHMNEEITEHEEHAQLPEAWNQTPASEPPKIATSGTATAQDQVNGQNDDSSSDSSSDDSSSDDSSSDDDDVSGAQTIRPDGNTQDMDNPDLMTAPDSDPEPETASQSSSESDDDDEAEQLDPEALAAMLMNEDGGEGGQTNSDRQPRTANERTDLLPIPHVTVTPETRKTPLGKVSEHLVDQMALIPSTLTSSDRVLDFGSLLCNEDLQVVGVVQDTIGRVQGPMYVTYCRDEEDRKRLGLLPGAQIYYVNDHSNFVFTQTLPSKGTDASNIHDEEINEDEQEFSDDEKEAEYKRMNKENKKAGNGKLSRGDFNQEAENWSSQADRGGRGRGRGGRGRGDRGRGRGGPRFAYGAPGGDGDGAYLANRGDRPQDNFSGGLNYDDDAPVDGVQDIADGDYTKNVRPDNLAELMTRGGGAPMYSSRPRGDAHGLRGRGDRGRGDRGRGRGNRGDRGDRRGRGDFQRGGGRGGGGNQQNGQRTSNNSYPDAHNNSGAQPVPQQPYPQNYQPQALAPQQQAIDAHAFLAQWQQQQAQQQQQQSYMFNGQQYQYTPQHAYPPAQGPAGGYVNPAFQQPQQQQAPAWQQAYQPYPPQQQQQWQGTGYQQPQTQGQPGGGYYQGAPQGQDTAATVQNVLQFLQNQNQQQGHPQ